LPGSGLKAEHLIVALTRGGALPLPLAVALVPAMKESTRTRDAEFACIEAARLRP